MAVCARRGLGFEPTDGQPDPTEKNAGESTVRNNENARLNLSMHVLSN